MHAVQACCAYHTITFAERGRRGCAFLSPVRLRDGCMGHKELRIMAAVAPHSHKRTRGHRGTLLSARVLLAPSNMMAVSVSARVQCRRHGLSSPDFLRLSLTAWSHPALPPSCESLCSSSINNHHPGSCHVRCHCISGRHNPAADPVFTHHTYAGSAGKFAGIRFDVHKTVGESHLTPKEMGDEGDRLMPLSIFPSAAPLSSFFPN